jgi:hypothetical protein
MYDGFPPHIVGFMNRKRELITVGRFQHRERGESLAAAIAVTI